MMSQIIADPEQIRRAINESNDRSRRFGIDPHQKPPDSVVCLKAEELEERRQKNRAWLDVAKTQIEELYRFVAGAGFAVGLVDSEGYMLEMIGDQPILDRLTEFNCVPGSRWTERDVGTSAVSLALAKGIAVQLSDEDHYIRKATGRTCSASPMFDETGRLIGVISMTGMGSEVHPHTLGMVITATKAIENQLRIMRASHELVLRNEFMTAVIESFDRGVMAVDRQGTITHVNEAGRRILSWSEELVGLPLTDVLGAGVDLERMFEVGWGFTDRETFIRAGGRTVHLITTAKPIVDSDDRVQGVIFIFDEIKRIRKLVSDMTGSMARFTFQDIIGESPAILEAKRLAATAAAGNSTVLILGETGTGKELFAQAIHNRSARRGHPFVAINCGAIPRELLESELFGYAEGAFTGASKGGRPGKFELASGGTVFLDEIGDMPVNMQVKLLRVLQTGEVNRVGQHKPIAVDLRIIAATHADLSQAISRGAFREDLYYRLNVFPIHIPPLRERSGDTVILARHILGRCCRALGKPGLGFSAEAEAVLAGYHWPGNVRELENVVERSVNLADGRTITPEHLAHLVQTEAAPLPPGRGGHLLAEAERRVIEETMLATGHNISRAAGLLGVSRTTLYNKLKKYGIPGRPANVQ